MNNKISILLFLLVIISVHFLKADKIHCGDGTIISGKIVSETESMIHIITNNGMVHYNKNAIVFFEKNQSAKDLSYEIKKTYLQQKYSLRSGDTIGLYNVIVFCLNNNLLLEAHNELVRFEQLYSSNDSGNSDIISDLKQALGHRLLTKAFWWRHSAYNYQKALYYINIIYENNFPKKIKEIAAVKRKKILLTIKKEEIIHDFIIKSKQASSNHIIVYSNQKELSEAVLQSAEQELKRIGEDIYHITFIPWKIPCSIILFDSYKDFQTFEERPNSPFIAKAIQKYQQGPQGSMLVSERYIISYTQAPFLLEGILPHELTHLIFRPIFGLNNSIPLWIDEGLSLYEQSKGTPSLKNLHSLFINSRFLPLRHILNQKDYPPYEHIFYAQSYSLVLFFITTFGMDHFQELAYLLSKGTTIDSALQESTNSQLNSLPQFKNAWKQWLSTLDTEK
ncbi:peptidase MA family metallohydrolase [Chlamydiota bacterium]